MLKVICLKFLLYSAVRSVCTMNIIDLRILELTSRSLAPILTQDLHKGQTGRIGIVGGSLEYTGAPYFAGISALNLGADLIHIFSAREAAPVIKSYSPELIVHPLLDVDNAVDKIEPWLERLHVLVIGPGLGRDTNIFKTVEKIISICRKLKKPLVIDADGLFLVTSKPEVIKNYPGVILTPNAVEFSRLFGTHSKDTEPNIGNTVKNKFGENCIIVKKGKIDEIFNSTHQTNCSTFGSGRRCGGQGDLLAGALAVFYNWALQRSNDTNYVFAACYAACKLTRECNARAYKQLGRSMTTSDMILQIGKVFQDSYEYV